MSESTAKANSQTARSVTLSRKTGRLKATNTANRNPPEPPQLQSHSSTTQQQSNLDHWRIGDISESINSDLDLTTINSAFDFSFDDFGLIGAPTDHADPSESEADEEPIFSEVFIGGEQSSNGGSRKRIRTSALLAWKPYRQEYLDELLRIDGFINANTTHCKACGAVFTGQILQCRDCFGEHRHCPGCILKNHRTLPYHRIELWNGRHWEKTSLKDLGLVVPLGHGGDECKRTKAQEVVTILHTNGFHHVRIRFCGCTGDPKLRFHRNQFLRNRLFPATVDNPKTAFTFDVLDLLSQQSTQGKISSYDFYHALFQITDNAEIQDWNKRYDELSHVIRWYKHLMMLKRAGRGHDPHGVDATAPGALALESPAAPHPGKNLPVGWESNEKMYLYALYLALDANFRLKQKERGFHSDETLGPGWAYFVDPIGFKTELDRVNQNVPAVEKSSCDSSFAALERANSRANEGYAVTGVVGVVDSRQGFVRPTGMADLQKGERYVNSDYVFLATTSREKLRLYKLTYDIICQWIINFSLRASLFPWSLTEHLAAAQLRVGIPKFHLPAHGTKCWSLFSLNFLKWWGRTDGEGIERLWAATNSAATIVREMGPGARHDYLDDQWGALNFRKLVGLGASLLRKVKLAKEGNSRCSQALIELNASLEVKQIEEWKLMVEQWQRDPHNNQDPYQESGQMETVADVRIELAEEEGIQVSEGGDATHEVSEGGFLVLAIELEDQQRALRAESSQPKLSPSKQAELSEKRSTLQRRIARWLLIQAIYMPRVTVWRQIQANDSSAGSPNVEGNEAAITTNNNAEEDSHTQNGSAAGLATVNKDAELFDLLLPSGLTPNLIRTCPSALIEKERRLRHAQLESILRDLRRLLRIKAGVYLKKRQNVTGQKAGTRANTLLTQFERKISLTVAKYQDVRKKLIKLDPDGAWKNRLQHMKVSDARAAHQDVEDVTLAAEARGNSAVVNNRPSEGKRQLSWIWTVPRADVIAGEVSEGVQAASQQEVSEAIRVEWAKSHARAERYSEELDLVQEEMRRVLVYSDWKAAWWRKESTRRRESGTCTEDITNGCEAYAE